MKKHEPGALESAATLLVYAAGYFGLLLLALKLMGHA
jgi:hypothetical protein